MDKIISGRARVFGSNIDTDQIYPGRFLSETDPDDVKRHAMAGVDPEFAASFRPGGLIVAGTNFGCGSSREHAAATLKAVGVGAVVAESFARIFFRNGVNLGIPLVACPGVSKKVRDGDRLTLDLSRSLLKNETSGEELPCEPVGDYALTILEAGGIKPLLKARYGRR
ncbi:3-isopropylmalate dehydratase small subunit [Pyramidobacter sp. YE332]|uniref:LeuD/DmdB family oxidoreductase small subunit n=1 Tax=Pyramidobacter sp. YE332 TaxID=3068894 RepID=UPI00294B33E4|nr:3-isopropylmalate dehydratase small subunit [Pyramidobacter sp. YE332]WOL39497.1 3-isopropylmalate dehydratase small subunit [Pyramidobacter sp. YE332]